MSKPQFKAIVESILSKKYADSKELIEQALLNKAVDRIEEKKVGVGKVFFESTEELELEEDTDEEYTVGDLVKDDEGNIGQIVAEDDEGYEVNWDLNEEQLDEISKKTVGSYLRKSHMDVAEYSRRSDKHIDRSVNQLSKATATKMPALKAVHRKNAKDERNTADKLEKKAFGRLKGYDNAVNKLSGGAKVPAKD